VIYEAAAKAKQIKPPWDSFPICPCPDMNCMETGTKLSHKTGHLVRVCRCSSCRGGRNQRKGKRAQATTHRRLGGTSWTPSNEESARPYQVEVTVMPEVKTGEQIPASWEKFVKTDWFRRALDQSARAIPVGSGARPCVVIRGQFAIVDIRTQVAGR